MTSSSLLHSTPTPIALSRLTVLYSFSLQLQLRKKDILRLNENNHVCARRGPEPCTSECKHRAWWCANATPTAHGWYASFDSWTSPSPSSEWPYVSAKPESNSKSIFPSVLDEAGGLPLRVSVVLCLKVFVLFIQYYFIGNSWFYAKCLYLQM